MKRRGLSGEEGTSFGKRGFCVGPAKVVCVCGSIPPGAMVDVEKGDVWDAGCAVGVVEGKGGMRYREEHWMVLSGW